MLEVLCSTVARIGEIAEITLDQIDMRTGDIWIQGEKSTRYRTIYLDDDARHYAQSTPRTLRSVRERVNV